MTGAGTLAIMHVGSNPAMSPTRVLIVDDQPVFRRQLRQLLTYAGLSVIGEAADKLQAEALTRSLQPDLAVVDVNLSGESGVSGTPHLLGLAPHMRVILVSACEDAAQLLQQSAREAGAEAFIPKEDLELELVRKWAEDAKG